MAESLTAAPSGDVIADETATADFDELLKQSQAMNYLAEEFPAWEFSVDSTSGWNGRRKELWEALQDGHHPQRALTPGKLYRRLDEYEARDRARAELAAKVL